MNIQQEIAELRRQTPKELRERYAQEFGEPTRCGNKQYLIKRIAWRMQVNAEGGMLERVQRLRARALQIANEADLRLLPPNPHRLAQAATRAAVVGRGAKGAVAPTDTRLPMGTNEISRTYKGKTLVVHVLADGFEYEGQFFKSLSAVAKHITGQHCNGYLFFKLNKPGARRVGKVTAR